MDLFADLGMQKASPYRSWFRKDSSGLFDERYFHNAAADASGKIATSGDGHFVTGSTRTAAGAFSDDEQHHRFTAIKLFADEMPKLEFLLHEKILAEK